MDDQQTQWLFAPEYAERFGTLPPSQQREALKRLTTRRRNPLTPDQCREVNSDVPSALDAIMRAYANKKLRSKASSAVKRQLVREPAPAEPEPEPEPVRDTAAPPQASTIVCGEAEPPARDVEATPAPEARQPEVVRVPPVCDPPKPAAKSRARAAAPPPPVVAQTRAQAVPVVAAVPKNATSARRGGLAGMLAR